MSQIEEINGSDDINRDRDGRYLTKNWLRYVQLVTVATGFMILPHFVHVMYRIVHLALQSIAIYSLYKFLQR